MTSQFARPVWLAGVLLLLCQSASGGVSEAFTRPTVASINLCTDQLVLLLADDDQIRSVSQLSQSETSSYLIERAREYPSNSGASEEILAMKPDLVLAGQYTTKSTVQLLRELGIRVEIVPIANSVKNLMDNIERVADLLGQHEKGREIVDGLQLRLEKLSNSSITGTATLTAAYYDPNGYTVGPQTLRGEALELAGWKNAAGEYGIEYYGTLSLESLVTLAPDALIDSPYASGKYSRGQQLLKHPALRASGLDPMIISVPSSHTTCAGPWTVDMIENLAVKRMNLLQRQ